MGINQKIYFASDFHLGMPAGEKSILREKKVVEWLNFAAQDATQIFLVGDIFDFWFEYKTVVPKGFFLLLSTLKNLSDTGIEIKIFPGNHDLWMFDYLEKFCGVEIVRNALEYRTEKHLFFVHHGDGLGPGDSGFKFIKKIFRARFAQFLFRWLHPDLGIRLATSWSKKSRLSQDPKEDQYLGDNKEYLTQFVIEDLAYRAEKNLESPDFYVFGHRHLVIDKEIVSGDKKSRYINLGHWFQGAQYAVYDGEQLALKAF